MNIGMRNKVKGIMWTNSYEPASKSLPKQTTFDLFVLKSTGIVSNSYGFKTPY